MCHVLLFFFFNDTATPEIYTLSLPDALPIYAPSYRGHLCLLIWPWPNTQNAPGTGPTRFGEEGRCGLSRADQTLFSGKVAHPLLQLFKRAHFDLADTFAADVILARQLFQRHSFLCQTTLGQDVFLSIV